MVPKKMLFCCQQRRTMHCTDSRTENTRHQRTDLVLVSSSRYRKIYSGTFESFSLPRKQIIRKRHESRDESMRWRSKTNLAMLLVENQGLA